MPYRKPRRKRPIRRRRPKKVYRRRRRFAKTTYRGKVVKVHSALPLPPKFTVKHRYIEGNVVMDPTGIAPVIYSFRANSLFDPNFSGVGHQPMGFDNIMPFYNHYTVIGSKIRVNFFQTDMTSQMPQIVGIYMNGQSTPTLTDWQTLAEQGNLTYAQIAPNANNNTSANSVVLTSKFSGRKFFGRRGLLTEDDFRGTSATNPAEEAYFHLFACPLDNSTNIGAVRATIELEYIAVYTELKQLAAS